MSFTTQEQPQIHVIGVSVRTSNAPGKADVDIPNLWMRFYREDIQGKVQNKASDYGIALYTDYEGDHTMPYTLILGCHVTSLDNIPEGLEGRTIPAGIYATFACTGKPPESILSTWQRIWQETNLNRTYKADYEFYKSHDDVTIFIGI